MKKALIIIVSLSLFFKACGQGPSSVNPGGPDQGRTSIHPAVVGDHISTRFAPPKGFTRTSEDSLSFANYLRSLPLKPIGTAVKLYNGKNKGKKVHEAVVDLPIGERNLHQCADAVIRLRAAYLFERERYRDIQFNFTNGFKADYLTWMQGNRIVVQGNQVFWKRKAQPSTTYKEFWKYLEMVFSYAGTASLSEELVPVAIDDIQIGDVFIQGGFPGHAILVVDMAENRETREKLVLLAQSYMPAQEIHILKNPNNPGISPWYPIHKVRPKLVTPEWVFDKTDLKRFPN